MLLPEQVLDFFGTAAYPEMTVPFVLTRTADEAHLTATRYSQAIPSWSASNR
ncbi:hypothetical protein ACFV9C_43640 [Kribbella sp. NPDC059898]|uniref:hypothetical protein n=1 Tax=Kribbella sp. NPDC059898 TaxID=3346995 RepID=UPI00364A397A